MYEYGAPWSRWSWKVVHLFEICGGSFYRIDRYDVYIDVYRKQMRFKDEVVTLFIYDTECSQDVQSESWSHEAMEKGHGFLFCFDMTQPETLNAIEPLIKAVYDVKKAELLEGVTPSICMMLVGTKLDLVDKIDKPAISRSVKSLCDKYPLDYIETSSKCTIEVYTTFVKIVEKIYSSVISKEQWVQIIDGSW